MVVRSLLQNAAARWADRHNLHKQAPFTLPDLRARRKPDGLYTVGVLVYQGVTTAEIAEPVAALAHGLDADVLYIGTDLDPVVGVEPVRTVHADATIGDDAAQGLDVLVIPGGLGWERLVGDPATLTWVAHTARMVQGVLAISTGSLVLASAGRLTGQAATGHWLARSTLSGLGADVRTERTASSRDDRLVTASGANSAVGAATQLAARLRWGPE